MNSLFLKGAWTTVAGGSVASDMGLVEGTNDYIVSLEQPSAVKR